MSYDHAVNDLPQTEETDPLIIREAADWLVKLEEGPLSDREQHNLNDWRNQSPKHELAWHAAMELKGLIGAVPGQVGTRVLGLKRYDRRMILRCLAALLVAGPAATLAYRQQPLATLYADLRTGYGQQKKIELADGSQLTLGTATAVNLVFDQHKRLLELKQGEVHIQTSPDPVTPVRPFMVKTPQGTITALGTKFIVRHHPEVADLTDVIVLEHAVAIDTLQTSERTEIQAGSKTKFSASSVSDELAASNQDTAWLRGQVVAENLPLAEFVKELNRYHSGVLRCDPLVAELEISGVFHVDDISQTLALVEETLPVRINRIGSLWMTVVPAN